MIDPNHPAIESLAREVVRKHGHLDRDALSRLERERLDLAGAVLAVSEVHDPLRVYDDCGDPECLNDHEWIADTVACEDSAIGWACARCCYYGEHPLECADHHGDHKGVPQVRACATRAALNGENA